MGDDEQTPLWRSPAVVAAGITGVLALVGVVVPLLIASGNDEEPRIVSVDLTAPVTEFSERCPVTLTFRGDIDVAGGAGEIVYRWVYRDVVSGPEIAEPVRIVRVPGTGTTSLRYDWTANVPRGRLFRTVALEVIEPVQQRSSAVTAQGVCDDRLPPGPDVPPPSVPGGPPA